MVQGSGGIPGMVLMTWPHWRGRECESLPSTGRLEGSVQSLDQRGCDSGHDSRLRFPRTSCQVSRSGCLRKASPAQEPCSEAHVATGPSLGGNTYPGLLRWRGPS